MDDFHDALGDAYESLARDLRRRPAVGTVDGRDSRAAIRGLANRRLHSRLIDIWRRASRCAQQVQVAPLEARRRPGVKTAPAAHACDDPIRSRMLVLDLERACPRLGASDRDILGRRIIGFEPGELAPILKITPLAARQRLHRARERLASEIAA